ncbi:hypothetical protein PR202_gb23209 [Eleusine coracana subsp. coracana]|uniref:HMA domain-containing protein n=1 Tax=Eleusine coracana subsp. coracana TaxID=191504 RepID=A0AAV5FIJ6_ELECO|nr:hypothetical protein QOZ80_6BG0481090 [Eleusine coracana subsp. coracana]GJN34538.1 hypothetical protein PR202_gb23209 [Eleusine coracana subsp. coracana]
MRTVRSFLSCSSHFGSMNPDVSRQTYDRQLSFFNSQEGVKRFRLHVEMHCRCIGCIRKVEKAMASIGRFNGIEMSVGDVDSGIVKVVGKVNPTEVCDWLKRETKKNVKVVCPDPPVENVKQKMILVLGSSSTSGNTAPSAPPLQDEMSWDLEPPGAQSYHESLQLIEEKIRELEKTRDALKIRNLENEMISVKHELKQSRKVIDGSKEMLLNSALNQLKAYKNLQALSQSPWY